MAGQGNVMTQEEGGLWGHSCGHVKRTVVSKAGYEDWRQPQGCVKSWLNV